MIGIARFILVGVNNELSVNGLELNFFDTERSIGNFLNGKWESFAFFVLSVHVDVGNVFTYTPGVCCDVESCCLCSCVSGSIAE